MRSSLRQTRGPVASAKLLLLGMAVLKSVEKSSERGNVLQFIASMMSLTWGVPLWAVRACQVPVNPRHHPAAVCRRRMIARAARNATDTHGVVSAGKEPFTAEAPPGVLDIAQRALNCVWVSVGRGCLPACPPQGLSWLPSAVRAASTARATPWSTQMRSTAYAAARQTLVTLSWWQTARGMRMHMACSTHTLCIEFGTQPPRVDVLWMLLWVILGLVCAVYSHLCT